jgi:hypothetical protein
LLSLTIDPTPTVPEETLTSIFLCQHQTTAIIKMAKMVRGKFITQITFVINVIQEV